jgi:hypothetical protein
VLTRVTAPSGRSRDVAKIQPVRVEPAAEAIIESGIPVDIPRIVLLFILSSLLIASLKD